MTDDYAAEGRREDKPDGGGVPTCTIQEFVQIMRSCTVYLNRDYNGGFIFDRGKCVAGKYGEFARNLPLDRSHNNLDQVIHIFSAALELLNCDPSIKKFMTITGYLSCSMLCELRCAAA